MTRSRARALRAYARRHGHTVLVAFVTAAVTAGAPAVANVVADYARNADKVDGRHAVGADASVRSRKGKLVATSGTTGKLPNDIINKAPNADHLDGKDLSQIMPVVRAEMDSAPALNVGPLVDAAVEINNVSVNVPLDGYLVITGTATITVNFTSPNQTFLLGPTIDGSNLPGTGSGPANRGQAVVTFNASSSGVETLSYTVVTPIGDGIHEVGQVLEHSLGTDSYYYTRNNLTVQFVPQGAVTYTDS